MPCSNVQVEAILDRDPDSFDQTSIIIMVYRLPQVTLPWNMRIHVHNTAILMPFLSWREVTARTRPWNGHI